MEGYERPPSELEPDLSAWDADAHVRPRVYLTREVAGIGGRIKERPEDFLVDEVPLYEPSGEGEHIYLYVEKRGMSTFELVELLAGHFGVPRMAIGYAGLKDRKAVTRQVMSVHTPGKTAEDFPSIKSERVQVLWADQHANKLRPGHLKGNRFSVRIRGVRMGDVLRAQRVMKTLADVGVANRFGQQRFGAAGNNHLVGQELIRGDYKAALDEMLGARRGAPASQAEMRRLYAAGDLMGALAACPRGCHTEQQALRMLVRGAAPARVWRSVDPAAVKFLISAAQSAVFNAVLDQRVEQGLLGELVNGDVGMNVTSRGVFAVDDAVLANAETRERLRKFDIAPTGPMWGTSMMRAQGRTGRVEAEALAACGLKETDLERFEETHGGWIEGSRRPLRVAVTDIEVEGGSDEHGEYVRLAFDLPRGAFATVVLEEVMKVGDLERAEGDSLEGGESGGGAGGDGGCGGGGGDRGSPEGTIGPGPEDAGSCGGGVPRA